MWFTVCEVPASILVDHLHVPWKDAAHCPELHYSMCYKIQMLSEVPPFFFSCTISMVMLGATAAVPSCILTEKEALVFPGTIYAS